VKTPWDKKYEPRDTPTDAESPPRPPVRRPADTSPTPPSPASYGHGGLGASAEARLTQLEFAMQRIVEAPLGWGIVAYVGAKRMLLSLGVGGLVSVMRHPDARLGDQVLVSRDTMAIVEVFARDQPVGVVARALDVTADGLVEVEIAQARRAVRASGAVAVGERVIVDPGLVFVVGSLGVPAPAHGAPEVSVDWDDVGGCEEAKAQLREAVELPQRYPELYLAYGKRPPRGVLLYGPPGTGKTLLAKATATSVARTHGRASVAAGGFQYIKGPELLNKWLGESEAAIRALFHAAREFRAVHGYPAVVFLDEADALLGDRNRGTNVSINATTVPQFLAEMDGFDQPAAIFLLATNRPELLDAAVTREGRVDRKVRVGRPSQADAVRILEIHLRGRPLEDGARVHEVATQVTARVFEPGALVVRDYQTLRIELRHLVSGAILAEVVERATTAALLRDAGMGRATPGGLSVGDLLEALAAIARGQRDVDHTGVLYELSQDQGQV
jgi:proteasome-associated ATPase